MGTGSYMENQMDNLIQSSLDFKDYLDERDEFLTEFLDACWHETSYRYYSLTIDGIQGEFVEKKCSCGQVSKLGRKYNLEDIKPLCVNFNFSTWETLGKLWELAKSQDWWVDFWSCRIRMGYIGFLHEDDVNPTRFADAVYAYLKGASNESENSRI